MPKSRDAESGLIAFTDITGIEIPENLWEIEYVVSGGRSFRLVPGADMPGQIAADWGDVAICSTELIAEAGRSDLLQVRLGEAVCRYSVLTLKCIADEWQDFLSRAARYPKQARVLPASFPRFLGQIAAGRDLPLMPMDVPVSGKGEATMRANGIGAVADRVVTGGTAQKHEGREVFWLADIFPELIIRRQNADL